ncbi:synaptopodin-2 isoform X2 [Engraulis encrasicolus]|uniref:synaptopodin-2 isoform X2 n=1 Tax=Engraulis encrasicolus TaxID=184585 RepID=UPI002FD3DE65
MEPVLEERESPDPDAWSGSSTPDELDDVQDEDYYGETETEENAQRQSQTDLSQYQQGDVDQDPRDSSPPSRSPEGSLSDYSAEEPDPDTEHHTDSDPGSEILDQAPLSPHGSDTEPSHSSPSPVQHASSHSDYQAGPDAGLTHSDSSLSGQEVTQSEPNLRGGASSPEEEPEKEGGGRGGEGSPGDEEGEGGGQSQAPPACVSFGIPVQGAEVLEDWGSEGERDLHRASRNGARDARLRRSQSQSEKQQKEAKSKCKRIALLLTNAPNPRNKGVLMFKKHRQRAKKFTLVSYGTGQADFDYEEDSGEYDEDNQYYDKDKQSIRITLSTPSDSELEEDYHCYIDAPECTPDLNYSHHWSTRQVATPHTFSWGKMEKLPETKGKGVLMFAQRRQRMDEISAEHEEMRSRGIPVEGVTDSEPETTKPFTPEDSYAGQVYMDASTYQHQEQLQQQQQQQYQQEQYQQEQYQRPEYPYSPTDMNGLDALQFGSGPKALVANRTAKPFLRGQNRAQPTFSPVRAISSPTPKKPETIFKVPVPINTAPQVWSPTGDIIASRDERIAIPAIKTGILPDTKRRGANKDGVSPQLQKKGDRRSFIESGPEEDYLSLGAEACNFMQAPRVKHKTPPPVAPKPSINPACPPWSADLSLPASRNPLPVSSPGPAGTLPMAPPHGWAPKQELQPAANTWGHSPSPTQGYPQGPANHWASASAHPQPQPWMPQQQQQVSMPSAAQPALTKPKAPGTKPRGPPSVSKAAPPPASSKGHVSETSTCPASDGPNLKGKGAELFARRQSRMEKFVVDADSVQANVANAPSPPPSLPSTWKYSPNVRAPPPTSYNPILSPSYPPGAIKQPPSTSPKVKSKAKTDKPKAAAKHLNALDVMKHKPYQIDSSLFLYNTAPEVKVPSPKPSPVPPVESPQVPHHAPPAKASGPVSNTYPFARQSDEAAPLDKKLPASRHMHDDSASQALPQFTPLFHVSHAPSGRAGGSSYSLPSSSSSLSSELVSRSALPMAIRPKFSAKKSAVPPKHWKPVALQH